MREGRNEVGNHEVGIRSFYECYDNLPPVVRQALIHANIPWNALDFVGPLEAGIAPEAVANTIKAIDEQYTRVEAEKTYGPDHPQARG